MMVVRNLNGLADAAGAESKRLRDICSSRRKAADRLEDYLLAQLQRADLKKVETPTGNVTRSLSPPRLVIPDGFDVSTLPDYYVRVSDPKPDARAILSAHKDGEPLPVGMRVERHEHLRTS